MRVDACTLSHEEFDFVIIIIIIVIIITIAGVVINIISSSDTTSRSHHARHLCYASQMACATPSRN
jgi:hypothetical protein